MIEAQFLSKARVHSEQQAIIESIKAALGRSSTYTTAANDSDGARLRATLTQQLRDLADQYVATVDTDRHIANIAQFCEAVSQAHSQILRNGRFRVGVAQKALNLYLKFLWCLDPNRARPPHCPIDRIVLTAAGINEAWTKLDSLETYAQWVASLTDVATRAGFDSPQDWELVVWNEQA